MGLLKCLFGNTLEEENDKKLYMPYIDDVNLYEIRKSYITIGVLIFTYNEHKWLIKHNDGIITRRYEEPITVEYLFENLNNNISGGLPIIQIN